METMLRWLAAAGAGLLGAMGLGGGGVLMLWLSAEGLTQRLSQGVNLIFILPVGLAGLWFHRRNGLVRVRLLLPLLLGGAVGVLLGSMVAGALSEQMLRKLFGILLLVIGARELYTGAVKMKPKH